MIYGDKIKSEEIKSKNNEILIEENFNNKESNISTSKKKDDKEILTTKNNNSNISNSLMKSPINCLNSITFNINNNYNNCYNNNFNESNNQTQFGHFNAFNEISSIGKNILNLNNLSTYTTKEKNKLIKSHNSKNGLYSIANNQLNDIKRTALFKTKSKNKNKNKINLNTNTNALYTECSKKSQKSSISNTNSVNINNTNNKNTKQFNEDTNTSNNNINTNSYSNLNNKEIDYYTINDIINKKDISNDINIIKGNNYNNQRNHDFNKEDFDYIQSMNSIKSYQRNLNNNLIEPKDSKDNVSQDNKLNEIGYQTFNGPFRTNMIKVNMISKEKNKVDENINKEANLLNSCEQKNLFKNNVSNRNSSNNKTNNINTQKKIYISNEIKGNKKCKKGSYSSNYKISNKFNKNMFDAKIKKDDSKNGSKMHKNSSLNNIKDNYHFNFLSLSRDNSTSYMKKKSNNNLNNYSMNKSSMTNRAQFTTNKKNSSISLNYPKSMRQMNDIEFKNNEYVPKIIPDYKIKLDKIKSRVIDLLNVYSLIALRSINDINSRENETENKTSNSN